MIAAGIKPRENHYAFLLREAAGRGAFEEAFLQVREMVEGGMKPRLRTYAPLLQGLCNKVGFPLASKPHPVVGLVPCLVLCLCGAGRPAPSPHSPVSSEHAVAISDGIGR